VPKVPKVISARPPRLRESNGGQVADGQSEAARARALRAGLKFYIICDMRFALHSSHPMAHIAYLTTLTNRLLA